MLKAGTAKTDITPPDGTPMAAFPVKRRPVPVPRKAEGFHDRLHARALALNDGSTDVIIGSADLCAIRTIVLGRIRERVCREVPDLKPERILVNVSHTHSGPEVSFLHGGDPEMDFVHVIEKQFSGCTAQFLNGAAGNIHPHQCMREGIEARDEMGNILHRLL